MLSQYNKYKMGLVKRLRNNYYLWFGMLLFVLSPFATVYSEVSPELLEKSKNICYKVTACYEDIKIAKSSSKNLECDEIKKECENLLNLKMLPLGSEEYKQSVSTLVWPGVWDTGVDATINWGNGKIYFFKKSQYIRFDIGSNKVDPGYPKDINNSTWPGVWTEGIDAAVNWGNGKAFFFRENQYVQYDIGKDESDPGYPKTMDEKSWPGIWRNGIDTATNWGNGKAYFFKENQYVSFDIDKKLSDPEYPKNINDTSGILWLGMVDDARKNTHTEDPLKSNISENYLGCYKEKGFEDKSVPSMENRDINKHSFESNKMTNELCTTSCADKGFDYAATQYGRHCFCGNSYGKYGDADICNMPCSGNSKEICGGAWANSIYSIKDKKEKGSEIQLKQQSSIVELPIATQDPPAKITSHPTQKCYLMGN